jgi:hypothetical protein
VNNEEEIIKGEAYLDMLKDKARETDELAKDNLELRKEIERLKQMKLHTEKYASEMEDKYILEKNKNNKAIEYIENNDLYYQDVDYDYEENMILEPPSDEEARAILLSILKGEDNE